VTKQKKNELTEEPQAEEGKNGTYGTNRTYVTHENTDLPTHASHESHTTHKPHSSPQKALYAAIREALAQGEEVRLPGLGVLMVRTSTPRMGRNPRTGESIAIPARNRVRFSLAGVLRSRLNP